MELPSLPRDFSEVIPYLNECSSQAELFDAVKPYIEYEAKLRQIFAQQPKNKAINVNHLVPVFSDESLITKARDIPAESDDEKEKYLLSLPNIDRHKDGSFATVPTIKDFKTNFNVFSEQSLVDLDWSNVVAAGSSVVTPLLPVDEVNNKSKRRLRRYYHEELAPASDVDLFIYGLDEKQAIEKMKEIESKVRDNVLSGTTTIRTKNAITIVSEYPVRHVQIVLRLYKSVTEILTGFDVDCSCVAFDGSQVWASPRALAAFATQQNRIDLTRRSPSYENRLSKYARRGFEVYWPLLDRARIDPTIYERAFNRVVGLARLLVLEKLPHPNDRDSYAEKRRKEKGRPMSRSSRNQHTLPGNVKDEEPDDVPDWLEDDHHSDYHTLTIPYGPNYGAKRIEKLIFKKDLLLNAEWNRSKDREANLHRHLAFFGSVDGVIQDCCGFCPKPETDEDLKTYEEESKIFISGTLSFMKDDPGRQAIGSFNPLTDDDWTDMAYLGSSPRLCQAIVDQDIEAINDWFAEEDADVNCRDNAGRTPLQLACMCSSPEIVHILIDHGARIVARIYNGMTALHMAAHRGNAEIVQLLLDKSAANEEEEGRKEDVRKEARRAAASIKTKEKQRKDEDSEEDESQKDEDGDIEMIDSDDESDSDDMTDGSIVKIREIKAEEEVADDPDVYDVDVLAWDNPLSSLHLAIISGHIEVIDVLIEKYGADCMLPVKLKERYHNTGVILNLVLSMQQPLQRAKDTIRTLLKHGASPAQADMDEISNLHYLVNEAKPQVFDVLTDMNESAVKKVVNHLIIDGFSTSPELNSPLLTAINTLSQEMVRKLIKLGADRSISLKDFADGYTRKVAHAETKAEAIKKVFLTEIEQPIIEAARRVQLVDIVTEFVEAGVDINTISKAGHSVLMNDDTSYVPEIQSLLDIVRRQIRKLAKYKGDTTEPPEKPEPLPPYDGPDLENYQSWILKTNYQQAEKLYAKQMELYNEEMKERDERDFTGEAEKQQAIDNALEKWRKLESNLLERGAKTFDELHPDAKPEKEVRSRGHGDGRSGEDRDRPFENKITFQVYVDLTDELKEKYIQLFEAAYNGDISTVKSLCLDSEDPLQIAIQDGANFSPFSLAVLREHYELARTILDIAATQYRPKKEKNEHFHYSIRRPDVDNKYDGNDDDDDFQVYKELVDEDYTIEDIRTLSDTVRSRVSPAKLFSKECELWRMLPAETPNRKAIFNPSSPSYSVSTRYEDEQPPIAWYWQMVEKESDRNSFGLSRFAIVSNNKKMLQFLLNLQKDLYYRKEKTESLQDIQIDMEEFKLAVQLGRTDMISDIIRITGMMLPLTSLAEQSGVRFDDKPEYYQGLTVNGSKRHDWAEEDRGRRTSYDSKGSPFLTAIYNGNITAVEYFLSDTPFRCYEEFMQSIKHDKSVQVLAKADGGIERALHAWLNQRAHLAIHMAVMADPDKSKQIRDFLIKKLPQFINAKSADGTTPLQLAILLHRKAVAKELIDAGADQMTRNEHGENLLHEIYRGTRDAKTIRDYVELLDVEAVRSLALSRRSGDGAKAQTPLMSALLRLPPPDLDVIDTLLGFSGGKDLEIVDGAGDYPIHALVREGDTSHRSNVRGRDELLPAVKHILKKRPDLLFRENATGSTALEIADTIFLKEYMENRPVVETPSPYACERPKGLTNRDKEDFLDPSKLEPKGTIYKSKNFLDSLKEIADRNPTPRKLVSLFDANEAARRLAEQQTKTKRELKADEDREKNRDKQNPTQYNFGNSWGNDDDEVSSWTLKAFDWGESKEL